jgi:hypothetical protein
MDSQASFSELLGKVFDHFHEGLAAEVGDAKYEQRRHAFVFHMTDWQRDLRSLMDLSQHPEGRNVKATTTEIIAILVHIIPHLNAAGRLLLDEISDPYTDTAHESELAINPKL